MKKDCPSVSDLLPPAPSEIAIRPPALLNASDLNLRIFFEPQDNTIIRLRPEIISLFPQILPILEWAVASVKSVLEKQHEIAGYSSGTLSDADEKSAAESALSIDQAVRTLNESIPPAVANIILKSQYADKPHLLTLFKNHEIPDSDRIRLIARRAITAVLQMGIVKSKRMLASECDVNPGQLSNFIRINNSLGMKKVIDCLEYVAKKAQIFHQLDELKRIIFDD